MFTDIISFSHPANLANDTIAMMNALAALQASASGTLAQQYTADHAFEAAWGQYNADILGVTTTMHDFNPGAVLGPGSAAVGGWVLLT